MRPSWSSFSSVSRAISRRTPSKPESSTAPGVSSMMKSIPVSVSSARMLRPSRPMMRPFSSSDFSSTDRHGGLDRVASGHALHAGGEDAAGAAVGVVAGLLLHLADQPRAVVAELVLQLAQEDLLGLAGAEPRHPLQLAELLACAPP